MGSRTLLAAGLLLAALASRSQAQQTQSPQGYWYLSYHQVDFPKVDSLQKLVRAYTIPIVTEQKKLGSLLDYRILIHAHGSRDNVVIMRRVASWAAIERDTTFQVAFRRVFPDSLKRQQITSAFNGIFGGGLHRDEIYREIQP